jgi:pimeloyl-ACP methyl ester carboxylesterase
MTGEASGLQYHLFVPAGRAHGPLVVLVHGLRTDPAKLLHAVLPLAARQGVTVMAPDFTKAAFNGYQRLGGSGGPLHAALALRVAVAAVQRQVGAVSSRFDLVGFSGGAQFAHRFAMWYPEHVRRLVIASAGWYTYLDPKQRYPYGVAPGWKSTGPAARVDEFLRVPILVTVGERDVERDRHLRTAGGLDSRQGEHRLERARRWVDHLAREALGKGIESRVEFALLPKTGHSLRHAVKRGRLGEVAFDFLLRHERRGVSTDASSNGVRFS